MTQPSTRLENSLNLNIQKDTSMTDLIGRSKKRGPKSRQCDQRQSYSKHLAGLLKPGKLTLSGQPDSTTVTEGAHGAFEELSVRKPTSARKLICLPCKRGKLPVRNLLSRRYLSY